MKRTIEEFGSRCRETLKRHPGPEGLERVRRDLEEILADQDFLATHLGSEVKTQRKVIYEDPELGFCVMAQVHTGREDGEPHDHGQTWAIYGQAAGVTKMTEYRVLEAPEEGKPGKVVPFKTYDMTPGVAVTYDVGQVHAPTREGDTRLVRILGLASSRIKRTRYEID